MPETNPAVIETVSLAEAPPAFVDPPPPTIDEEAPRGTIAEWTITILLLLFLTTMLVQAFVIPTGSMEDTLLIGDHLLVDKLAFAPGGPISKYILPYKDVKRGDIIVFRYPVDIRQTFVKRAVGIPGDRIKLIKIVKPRRVKSPAMASYLTGGTKVAVMVAVAVGLVVVLGIVAAKNTK